MSSEEGSKCFMPKKINCITIKIIITLEGIEEIKQPKNKMIAKQPEEYFFHRGCKKTLTNTGFSISLFIGFFHWTKIHSSPPNSPS